MAEIDHNLYPFEIHPGAKNLVSAIRLTYMTMLIASIVFLLWSVYSEDRLFSMLMTCTFGYAFWSFLRLRGKYPKCHGLIALTDHEILNDISIENDVNGSYKLITKNDTYRYLNSVNNFLQAKESLERLNK